FDKGAAILELGYPGGPLIDKLAKAGNSTAIRFPRTRVRDSDNFSFSGLKTAVLYHVHGIGQKYGDVSRFSHSELADIAATFQAALTEPLVRNTVASAAKQGVKNVVVGGGVAANSALRSGLKQACDAAGLNLILTPMQYCTDNAAMIAALGHHRFRAGDI